MREFLEINGSEIENMLFVEFNMDDAKKVWWEEALEEGLTKGRVEGEVRGRAEGEAFGRASIALSMIKEGFSFKKIADLTGFSYEDVANLAKSDIEIGEL
jgi:predicted transposase YdaD